MKYFLSKQIGILSLIVCCLFVSSLIVWAETEDAVNDSPAPGFIVTPKLPENQRKPGLGYFDLRVTPNLTQTLEFTVKNTTDRPIPFLIEAKRAGTNRNGIIDYSLDQSKEQSTAPVDIQQVLNIAEPRQTIQPGEEKIVQLTLDMPDISFDGVVLGAITFQLDPEKPQEKGTNNQINYTIGVVLSQNDTAVAPELQFEHVQVVKNNDRTFIEATIQNTEATIVDDLKVSGKVFAQNKELFSRENIAVRMAPNSLFTFPIDTTGEAPLEPGEYTLELTAVKDEQTWGWSESFTIDAQTAEEMKPLTVVAATSKRTLWLIGLLTLLVLVLAFFSYVFWRKHRMHPLIERKATEE